MFQKTSDIFYPLARVYFDYKKKNKYLEVVAGLTMVFNWTM